MSPVEKPRRTVVRTIRTLLSGAAVFAVAVTGLAMPSWAADTQGTLALVNGIPGKGSTSASTATRSNPACATAKLSSAI
jgi:hypothetical protein